MTWPTWIAHEPVAWIGLVDALLVLVVTFGLDRMVGITIDNDKKLAIDAFLQAIAVLLTRSVVTPNAKLTSPPQISPTGGAPSGTP